MKAFKFRLESVLVMREQALKVAERNHAEAGRALEQAMLELWQAQQEASRMTDQLEAMQRTNFRPAERNFVWTGIQQQQRIIAQCNVAVDHARAVLDEKRNALLAAKADHEGMLKLREKALSEYRRAAEAAESAMIDDIVNARQSAMRRAAGREAHL